MSPKLLILSDPRARAYALSDSTVSVSDLSEQWKSPYVNPTVGEERCGRCLGVGTTAYWARPDSEIPAISATMHTSCSYITSV